MNWNDVFEYIDGYIRWRIKPSNAVNPGDIVKTRNRAGYVVFAFKGKQYRAHRVIWEMQNGPIPEGMEIDHINHVRDDNTLENLRVVSRRENLKNQSMQLNNSSGHTGVRYDKKRGKWKVSIKNIGKLEHVGYFDELPGAISARKKAEEELGFHENHGV